MKKTKPLKSAAALLLCAVMAFSFPFAALASSSSVSPYTGKTYTHSSRFDGYDLHNGIDVSSWNGDIDWNAVKADGVEFVFVRAGFTGYTKSTHSINPDTKAAEYIAGAHKAGLPVGVYWFSQALTTQEALAEAQKTLEVIKDFRLELPVFFDYEFNGGSDGRLTSAWNEGTITKSQMTANTRAFCSAVENAGYEAGVYANKSFLEEQIDGAGLAVNYKVWLAHFTTETSYAGGYYMWQYTESGSVDGISGTADCDFMYLPEGEQVGAPRDIKGFNVYARGDGGTDLYLEWQGVHGADEYQVYIVSGGKETLKGTAKDSRFVFTDLTPGWEYDVRVKALADGEVIAQNGAYRVCAACPTVTNVKINSNYGKGVNLSWQQTSGHGYIVQWSADKSFKTVAGSKTINGTANTSCTINASNTDELYFRVRAFRNYNGSTVTGEFSEPVKGDMALTAATGFNVYARGGNGKELYLEWTGDEMADGYRVYVVSGGGDVYKGTVENNRFTFTDFTPGWEYDVKVVSYNSVSTVGATYRVCAALAQTQGVTAAASNGAIAMSWDEMPCHGYLVQWSTDESFGTVSGSATINGSANNSYTITGLDSGKVYYVRARAWRNFGSEKVYGAFSEAALAAAAPVTPTDFNVYARGDGGTDLYLEWSEDKNVDSYRIYIYSGTPGTDSYTETLKGDTTENRFVFTDLNPGWEYNIMVVASNEIGRVCAKTAITAAPAPVEYAAATIDGSEVTAIWAVTPGHGYIIQWSTDQSFKTIEGSESISGSDNNFCTFTVNGDPADYYIRVRATRTARGEMIGGEYSPVHRLTALTESDMRLAAAELNEYFDASSDMNLGEELAGGGVEIFGLYGGMFTDRELLCSTILFVADGTALSNGESRFYAELRADEDGTLYLALLTDPDTAYAAAQ